MEEEKERAHSFPQPSIVEIPDCRVHSALLAFEGPPGKTPARAFIATVTFHFFNPKLQTRGRD